MRYFVGNYRTLDPPIEDLMVCLKMFCLDCFGGTAGAAFCAGVLLGVGAGSVFNTSKSISKTSGTKEQKTTYFGSRET